MSTKLTKITHYFMMKFLNKGDLQQIAHNHLTESDS